MAAAKEARERKAEKDRPKDYGYIIRGQARWKPLKVWSDGVKTYIRMPSDIQEQPSLMLSRGKAWLFKKPEMVLVNYRVHGDIYVVDSVISKGTLQIGVGGDAEKITIIHITYTRRIATHNTAHNATTHNTYGYGK
jgi:type IV secretory pathway VirB9-like protein